ncbi:MAG: exodeoxyribonuclease VII large subunit, partial [Clostridia bacterium]|nr:exodeoxyribonuclease VII large subunit [Clostridia bacterium]
KLPFRPENGMKVIVEGRLTSYERDGQVQLYLTAMQPDGVGALHLAFEQLKAKLAAEGLFDPARKQPLPKTPLHIGVITASTGAAVRDIIHVLGRRFPAASVLLYPVLVQGEGAPPMLVEALQWFNDHRAADLIILGRGGGSMEDLWAFNNESVARAIAASSIPVISAVGHETDFTIADFVADLRAPTPSAAAEMAVPDAATLRHRLGNVNLRMADLLRRKTEALRGAVRSLGSRPVLQSPERMLEGRRLAADQLSTRLVQAQEAGLERRRRQLALSAGKLGALSPLSVMERGYAVAARPDGAVIRDAAQLTEGEVLDLRFQRGRATAVVQTIHPAKEEQP